jgi:dipeptidase E
MRACPYGRGDTKRGSGSASRIGIIGAASKATIGPREGIMRLLLTSAGIKNASIQDALVELLDKPIAEADALCIPTAMYGHPMVGPGTGAWRFISGRSAEPMCELGWRSLGVLELAALPSIDEELWVPKVQEADVLLVAGGDALYLCHWMRESGLAELLPSLRDTVWVGLSAGSMVMTPRIGEDFVGWTPPTGGDGTLGIVDFSISEVRRTRSTIRPPSKWSTAPPKSSPRGTGSCLSPDPGISPAKIGRFGRESGSVATHSS